MNISWMSRSLPTRPLIRYSLWPERYSRRQTTTSPGFIASAGFSAVFFFRLNLPPGSAGDGAEPSAAASCVSGGCAGSSERISVVSVKPESSLFSMTRVAESVAESDAPSNTKRAASASSGSSRVMVTSASPSGGRLVVPLKMQSAMRSARSDLWLCSPSTQEMASTTLDFPHPFGPTMQVVPVPLNVTTVRSQNDLKPTISTFRSLSKVSPLVSHRTPNLRLARHPNSRNHSFPPLGGGRNTPAQQTPRTARATRNEALFSGKELPSTTTQP